MSRAPTGVLAWNLEDIARALRIGPADVCEYFTDGRRISFILERRIAVEVLQGSVAKSEGASYDLVDREGAKWDVRSISRGGVYFCPSYMVGSGRSFETAGFLNKLNELKGYILADIECFPEVPFWIVPATEVRKWWDAKQLGTSTKVSREKALKLIASSPAS